MPKADRLNKLLMLNPFLRALQFLTRIPVPVHIHSTPRQLGQSVLFYPLVGLLLGLLLTGLSTVLAGAEPNLKAAIILAAWVFLSGGLHLDGLADCADAWVGGTGNREKTLAILKDPAAGAVAVITLILLILLKWSALTTLLAHQQSAILLWIPVLGRSAILVLMLTTPYIRKNGLGEQLTQNLPRTPAWIILGLVGLIAGSTLGWLIFFSALLILALLRRTAISRLGGMTGDVYGASVELIEMTLLVSLALYV
jgi:adenosylcobinamide-GDP ribazoletransferase